MKKNKQKWGENDIFAIPLVDGSICVGRVISHEKQALNSVLCAFYSTRFDELPEIETVFERAKDLVSLIFVSRDGLETGWWKVIGSGDSFEVNRYLNLIKLREEGFIGVTVEGSDIVVDFLNAFNGLIPWDSYYDPNYFDGLLISPDIKPKVLKYK